MSANRIREHLSPLVPSAFAAPVAACCAFVSCPVFAAMPVAQQVQVQAIYRLAAERTREQLRRRLPWPPQFSAN